MYRMLLKTYAKQIDVHARLLSFHRGLFFPTEHIKRNATTWRNDTNVFNRTDQDVDPL